MEKFEQKDELSENEKLEEVKKIKVKPVKLSRSEDPGLKVVLPAEISVKVQAALKELKGRKVDCKAEDLLSEFLSSLSEEYLKLQIQQRTPEDYYLEVASQIPELRAKLIEQAKTAILSSQLSGQSDSA